MQSQFAMINSWSVDGNENVAILEQSKNEQTIESSNNIENK